MIIFIVVEGGVKVNRLEMEETVDRISNIDNFKALITLLKVGGSVNDFTMGVVYKDYGLNWKWETIIAYRPDHEGLTGSYQILNPRDWDLLNRADGIDDVVKIAKSILEDQKKLMF
jgi:hypothetical protein